MKNNVFLLLLIIALLLNTACHSHDYESWQEVNIQDCGILSIPNEWAFEDEDEYIYVLNKNHKPVIIQSYSVAGIEDNQQGTLEDNKYFKNVQAIKCLSSTVFSNGAIYGKIRMSNNGKTDDYYYIELHGDRWVQLVFWDQSIDEDMVRRIADSWENKTERQGTVCVNPFEKQ